MSNHLRIYITERNTAFDFSLSFLTNCHSFPCRTRVATLNYPTSSIGSFKDDYTQTPPIFTPNGSFEIDYKRRSPIKYTHTHAPTLITLNP